MASRSLFIGLALLSFASAIPSLTVSSSVFLLTTVSFVCDAMRGLHSMPKLPDVRGDGASVLQAVDDELQGCGGNSGQIDHAPQANTTQKDGVAILEHTADSQRRASFVCGAQCAAREPQLERSLSPFADWSQNSSGADMLDMFMDFCKAPRSCNDAFVMLTLMDGDVHTRACGGKGAGNVKNAGGLSGLLDETLYLVGPEDLSMVMLLTLGIQRFATLPKGPIVFGMYLSDYSCLGDRHMTGPGMPIFSYLSRDTSWLIPFPSSFNFDTTREVETLDAQQVSSAHKGAPLLLQKERSPIDGSLLEEPPLVAWGKRDPKAYWIGAVTGPWEVTPDADLMALPRLKLLTEAHKHPNQLHAEWSSLASYGLSWVKDETHVSGFMGKQPRTIEELTGVRHTPHKGVSDWSNYKYYVNIDGNVMGGRMNKLLAQGGVVLQQKAGYYEYFEGRIEPYVHYIPFEYDMSDLVPKIEWLQKNDDEARKIASNGQHLAKTRLRFEDHICYIWRALEGIGTKTASAPVDSAVMKKKLEENNFLKVSVQDNDMRKTLESFWGKPLEQVRTGERRMSKDGIKLLEWAWSRMAGLTKQTQPAAK